MNSSKYSYISIHDGHGLMMMYDIHMHLDSFNTITNDGSKYILETFNTNTHPHTHTHTYSSFMFNFYLLSDLQTIIQESFEHCLIIVMGDFNVDIKRRKPKNK
jgi:hypothetical protein